MQPEHNLIRVSVHYVAAGEPFQHEYPRNEAIGQVKKAALNAFHLSEGTDPSGNVVAYTLYHQKTPLENLTETIGEVARHEDELQLKLSQQITQGA